MKKEVDKLVDVLNKSSCLLAMLILSFHIVTSQNPSEIDLANDYVRSQDYVKCLQILLNLEHNTGISDKERAKVYLMLAECYDYFDYKDKALFYFEKSYTIHFSLNDSLGLAICLTKWGDLLEDIGKVEQAFKGFDFAKQYFNRTKDTLNLILLYNNISSAYENIQQYDQALDYLKDALKLIEANKDTSLLIMTYNNMGDVFRKQNQNKKAVSYYLKAIELSTLIQNEEQKRAALKDISKSYAELKDFEKAYATHYEFYELNSKLKTKKKIDEVAQLQLDIIAKFNEARVKNLEEEKEKTKFRFLTTVSVLVFSSLVMFGFFIAYRFKTQKEKELALTNQKLLESEMRASLLKNQLIESELAINKQKLEEFTKELITRGKVAFSESTHSDESEDDKLKTIDELSKSHLLTTDDWNQFKDKFEKVFPQFFTRLREKYPDLSAGDIRLTAMLKLRLKSEEIANLMGISTDSVKKAKFRLKKKLAPNELDFSIKKWADEL